jgi:exopolysaccharide production protein ExoQ
VYALDRPSAVEPLGWQRLIREVVAIGWLCIASAAVYVLLVQGDARALSPAQEMVLRLFVLPSLPLAAALFLLRWREISETLLRLPFLSLLILAIWASVTWSLEPGLSLRRALSITAYTLIAIWLALAFEPSALLRRLAWIALAILLLSIVFAVALPGLAFMELEGRTLLRGVFSHKNVMGQHLGFSAILFATSWHFRLIPRWAAGLGLLLCLILTIPTGSATAFLILLTLAVTWVAARVLLLPPRLAVAVLCFGLAAGIFVVLAAILGAEQLLGAFGRDLSLTGRVPLWYFVWWQIKDALWLGHGYAVFFDIPWVQSYTREILQWGVPNAHNGYLELWLGIGIAGPVLASLFLAAGIWRGVVLFRLEHSPAALFAVYYLPIYFIRNVVESDLVTPNQLSWVLAVIAATMTLRPSETQPDMASPHAR